MIKLIEPEINEYDYEQKLLSDQKTMDYNAGYDVTYDGYNYETGCIDFPVSQWEETYNKRKSENRFFAYIFDTDKKQYVGYVNYNYNILEKRYECGIVIEGNYRNYGYSKEALKLLCHKAFENNIDSLYDTFEKTRLKALKIFTDVGFEICEEKKWKKFGKDVEGIVICLKKDNFIY